MKNIQKLIKNSASKADYSLYRIKASGITSARPTLTTADAGFQYYDTTIGKPVWWSGTAWKDASGIAV